MDQFRKILPQFSHFCLALLLSVLANGVFFFHSHELDNGRIITHAHPLLTEEQQELPDHGHTEEELLYLDLIAHAEYFLFDFQIDFQEVLALNTTADTFVVSINSYIDTDFGFEHRGPPIV
ncbi:hypothetical protein MM236_07955 [Belliella sp. DSM 107340]|uniref:Uncharacterized protein n=1 Tax=Belliella calami TaxID=2923436 RepID=A0ABS9UN16_9BACT|nr:hypothetical protein [Belliella calami]MCH7397918.1 hypothetical protein [Belliella calami]